MSILDSIGDLGKKTWSYATSSKIAKIGFAVVLAAILVLSVLIKRGLDEKLGGIMLGLVLAGSLVALIWGTKVSEKPVEPEN